MAIREEGMLENYLIVSLEDTPRRYGGLEVLPWKAFLENLWQDAYA